jgi:hypothetical protein
MTEKRVWKGDLPGTGTDFAYSRDLPKKDQGEKEMTEATTIEDLKALIFFEKEMNYIQDESLKTFFHNALVAAPLSFHNDEETMAVTKRAYHILRGFLEARDIKGVLRDAMLGTVLLCDIMVNEFDEDMRPLHTVAVRNHLRSHGVDNGIQRQIWENIMRAVESHEGDKGASPLLDAKPGTAEFELLQAFNVARLPYIQLDWEVTYNEIETDDGTN